jgi:hypothetical protein
MQQLFTKREAEAIALVLAEFICHRCKFPYSRHGEADHYFFAEPEDAVAEESN